MHHPREAAAMLAKLTTIFRENTLWGQLVRRSAFHLSLAARVRAMVGRQTVLQLSGRSGSGRTALVTPLLAHLVGVDGLVLGDPDGELAWLTPGAFSTPRRSLIKDGKEAFRPIVLDTVTAVPEDVQHRLLQYLERGQQGLPGSVPLVVIHDIARGHLRDRLIPELARPASLNCVEVPGVSQQPDAIEIAVDFWWPRKVESGEQQSMKEAALLGAATQRKFVERLRELPLDHSFRDIRALVDTLGREVLHHQMMGGEPLVESDLISLVCSRFVTENAMAGPSVLARRVVSAYVAGRTLDEVLSPNTSVSWRCIQDELQLWLGEQVQRTARLRGCAEGELIDMSQRQLQNWRRRGVSS